MRGASLERHTSGVWRIRFRYAGQRFYRSLGEIGEEAAETIRRTVVETLGLLSRGRLAIPDDCEDMGGWIIAGGRIVAQPRPKDRPITLGETVRAYFAEIPEGAKEANSLATEAIHLQHLTVALGEDAILEQIGVAALQRYVAKRSKANGNGGRKLSPATLKKELDTFGQLWNFAKVRGMVSGTLDRKSVRLPKASQKPPFQTREEIERQIKRGGLSKRQQQELWDSLFLREGEVLEFLDYVEANGKAPWLHPMAAIAAFTGARRSEILRSELDDFDLEAGTVLLREKKRRRDVSISFRRVDLHPKLATIARHWFSKQPGGRYTICERPNEPITPKAAWYAWESTIKGSKWSVLRGYHVLRHSFASICATCGVRESTISAWMGHATEEMRDRYRHLFPERTREEMRNLFRVLEAPHS